jgi:ADP-ribosylglycohydrolase
MGTSERPITELPADRLWEATHGALMAVASTDDRRLPRGLAADDSLVMATLETLCELAARNPRLGAVHVAFGVLTGYRPDARYAGQIRPLITLWMAGRRPQDAAVGLGDGAGLRSDFVLVPALAVALRHLADREVAVAQARSAAEVTHRHPVAIDAAGAYAAAVVAAAAGQEPLAAALAAASTPELRDRLAHADRLRSGGARAGSLAEWYAPGGDVLESLPLALLLAGGVRTCDELEHHGRYAPVGGGAADALAGALIGAREGRAAVESRERERIDLMTRGRLWTLTEALHGTPSRSPSHGGKRAATLRSEFVSRFCSNIR